MEFLFLMNSFLKSREQNTLIAEVTGSRKRENGLVVPCIYHGRLPSHQVAKTLKNEPCKASKLCAHMQTEVPDTPVTKKGLFLRTDNFLYSIQVFHRIFNKKNEPNDLLVS